MAIFLRQSTASQEVLLGPFLDPADGSAETGLTIANTDIKLFKFGATSEANKNSGGATHVASGRYYCVLDATDTDTIGPLEINVAVSGALPVRRECVVLHANVFDWLFGSAAPSTHAASAVAALVLATPANLLATDSSGRVLLQPTQSGVTIPTVTTVGSVTGSVGSVTGAVGSVTGNVGGNVTGSVGSLATQAKADVNAEVDAALADYDPPTKAELDAGFAALNDFDPASDAVANVTTVGSVTGSVGSVAGNVSGSVGSISGVTFPANFADLAIAATTGRVTVGTNADKSGYSLAVAPLDAAGVRSAVGLASANLDTQLGTIDSNVDAILDDTGTSGVVVASGSKSGYSLATAPPTASEVADAVWDEAQAGHTTPGTFGEYLDAQVSTVGGGSLTAADIADAVWDEAIAGHLGPGSTGEALNAAGGSGDPWVTTLPGSYTGSQAGKILADILADTAEIGAAGAGLSAVPWNAAWDAEVQSECADALAAYDPPTKAELDSGLAALNDFDPATDTVANVATVGSVTGTVDANLVEVGGDAIPTPDVAGVPKVDLQYGDGLALYPATQAGGDGTATLVLAADEPPGTEAFVGHRLLFPASGEVGTVSAYDGTTKTATFSPALDQALSTAGGLRYLDLGPASSVDAAGIRAAVGLASANLDAQLAAIDSVVDAVLADTGTDGVVVAAGSKSGYALSSSGLDAVVPAEPAGAPSWGSATIVAWVGWLGAFARNKVTQTATTLTLRNDADNAAIATAAVSDDGDTFVRGELS